MPRWGLKQTILFHPSSMRDLSVKHFVLFFSQGPYESPPYLLKMFLKKLTYPLSFIIKTFPLMFWVAWKAQFRVYQEHLLSAAINCGRCSQHLCDCWCCVQGEWGCGAELMCCRLSEPGMGGGAAPLAAGGQQRSLGEVPVSRGTAPWLGASFCLRWLSLAWACPELHSLSCFLYNFIPTAYTHILSKFLSWNPQKEDYGWAHLFMPSHL